VLSIFDASPKGPLGIINQRGLDARWAGGHDLSEEESVPDGTPGLGIPSVQL
jgi:hypothetical protein